MQKITREQLDSLKHAFLGCSVWCSDEGVLVGKHADWCFWLGKDEDDTFCGAAANSVMNITLELTPKVAKAWHPIALAKLPG